MEGFKAGHLRVQTIHMVQVEQNWELTEEADYELFTSLFKSFNKRSGIFFINWEMGSQTGMKGDIFKLQYGTGPENGERRVAWWLAPTPAPLLDVKKINIVVG